MRRFSVRSRRQQRWNTISVFWQTRPSPGSALNPSSAVYLVHYSFCNLGLGFDSTGTSVVAADCFAETAVLVLFFIILFSEA